MNWRYKLSNKGRVNIKRISKPGIDELSRKKGKVECRSK